MLRASTRSPLRGSAGARSCQRVRSGSWSPSPQQGRRRRRHRSLRGRDLGRLGCAGLIVGSAALHEGGHQCHIGAHQAVVGVDQLAGAALEACLLWDGEDQSGEGGSSRGLPAGPWALATPGQPRGLTSRRVSRR